MQHWTVDINEDGSEVVVEGHGFKGKQCELPPDLMAALGQKTSETKKPEYHQAVGSGQKIGGR